MTKFLKTFKNKDVTISITGVKSKGTQIGVIGILLDFDGTFVYLGEEVDGEVIACVPYNKIATVYMNDAVSFAGPEDNNGFQ